MLKKATIILLTLILLISSLSAVSFTASAANNSKQLMVVGNQLVFVDEPTKTVRLTGVNVPGGEWTGTPGVERIERSVTWAIDNWDCNIIRLPVSINGWTGNYSYVYDGGKSFKNYIDSVINIASERGAYVILDLHHYTSFNKEDYITFWQEAAVRYKNNPTVLFGILNEPHSTSWDVWRDGDGSSVYGHQYVVEMIRDLGAKNIIVAGGLDWAYNVSGVVNGYALIDQGTNNNASKAGYGIMYDTHIYPWKGHTSNWDSKVGAVRKAHPILVGECGWDEGTIAEIAKKYPQPGDPLYHDKWVPELLAWMDDDTTYGAKANYTGYCMHPSSAPQLITDPDANGYGWKDTNYSYTPTDYWGVYLVPHLEAAVATRYGTLNSVQVTNMTVVNPKTTYNVGDSFDKSTGYLDVTYSDSTTAKVNLSDSGVTITGFNSSAVSESQTITIAYGGKTTTYTVAIVDTSSTAVAKTYLDIDFEDAAYQVVDGADNYAVIETTNKATGNKIGISFNNSNDSNRYQVQTDSTKYIATKGRKTNSKFDIRPETSISDKKNKVYVEMRIKRVSPTNDDPVSIVFTDDSANPIFRLNYTQNTAPSLVADATYSTVTYPAAESWTTIRAIIDFSTSTFELYQGTDLNSLTAMVTGTTTFGFESTSATNLTRITNNGIGNTKGSLGFDDIKIYTVGEDDGGDDTPAVTLSSISVSDAQTSYSMGDAFVAPTVTAAYSDGTTKTVTGATFSGYNMSVVGSQTVTASYGGKTTTYTINVAAPEKVVASISVSNVITQYTWGDEFIEPTVTAKYTNSYYADEVVTGAIFNNFSMTDVRTHTVRVIYGGKTTTYSITVSAPNKVIDSIEVSSSAKTDYVVGDTFVVPSVIVKYTSDYYSAEMATPSCTGYNMSTVGTQTVTASYGGLTDTYQITVSAAPADYSFGLTAGTVKAQSGDTSVSVPLNITEMLESKSISGLAINVSYDAEELIFDSWTPGSMIKAPSDVIVNSSQAGTIKITFSSVNNMITPAFVAENNLFGTLKFGVADVYKGVDSSVTIEADDDLYDETGMAYITADDLDTLLVAGSVTVPAATPSAPTITSISVSGQKTSYYVGDSFVKPTVIAVYSDGSTKTVTATFTGYDMSREGTQTVTVSCNGQTTTYQIIVTKKPDSDYDFELKIGTVEGKVGDTTVNVPINVTKMFASKSISGLAINVYYDADKLSFAGTTGWTPGSMIKVPADVIINTTTEGRIKIMFSSASDLITPALVAENNLFGTITFTVKDSTSELSTEIAVEADDDLYDETGMSYITMDDLDTLLVAGSVTVPAATPSAPTITSISVSGQKTSYYVGDSFVTPTVIAVYSDGSTKTVTATFTGYDMSKEGTQTVTVSYNGQTTTYQIIVTKKPDSDYDFELKIGTVEGKVGDTTVNVPINVTKMFANKSISGLAINVYYDADKLSFAGTTGWTPGSMIKVPADVIINTTTEGRIKIMFSSASDLITPALVAENNLFGTITFTVKDSTSELSTEIAVEADDDLYDETGMSYIAMDELNTLLVAGSIYLQPSAQTGYDAEVLTSRHIGYDEEHIDVYYVKSLTLTEGNGEYRVKVGDYELSWSEERQCYVGVTAQENYDVESKKFLNISIEKNVAAPTIKYYGDVTGDNRINISDLAAVKNYIQLGTPLPVRYAADTNLDGNINITDLSKLKFYVEKMIPIF